MMNHHRQLNYPIDPHYRKKICRIGQHEVGHYIAARVLGFKTGPITLTMFDLSGGHHATAEIILCCSLKGSQEIDSYLERRAIVLYAGALAESLNNGNIDYDYAIEAVKTGGAVRDADKVRELVQLLRSIRYPDTTTEEEVQAELDKLEFDIWNKAAEIVMADQEIIVGLGQRIAGDVKATNQKVALSAQELESLPVIRDRFGDNALAKPSEVTNE